MYVHCRREGKITRWRLFATERQAGADKPADYYRCDSCSSVRLQLLDVTDAESLCVAVIEDHFRRKGRHERFDEEDALGHLNETLWKLFLRFDGRGTFTGYATSGLRWSLSDWIKLRVGRVGRGDPPKPLDVADSVDAGGEDGLERALGSRALDDREDRSSHLAGVLAKRSGGIAREDRAVREGQAS